MKSTNTIGVTGPRDSMASGGPLNTVQMRVLLSWPEGRSPLAGKPAVCLVAGQARGHYCFL
jgi:hypothetical protein